VAFAIQNVSSAVLSGGGLDNSSIADREQGASLAAQSDHVILVLGLGTTNVEGIVASVRSWQGKSSFDA
jgi:hypothetical protein